MPKDVVELVERYLSEDPSKWAKLASDIQWRRLQLLLLREVLVELRDLKQEVAELSSECHSQPRGNNDIDPNGHLKGDKP